MANTAPSLPTRFPCWCRATYSWGGETKRDLGFVEGDLIECLNAGDGAWWMGRLFRDKRATGLFPSNFVQVMDETFRPMNRATSPMPLANGGSMSRTSTPQKAKTFRKPFQAYTKATSPNPVAAAAAAEEARSRVPSPSPHREPGYSQRSQMTTAGHKAAIAPRGPSPAPSARYLQRSQALSSELDAVYGSRAPSPSPPTHYSQTPGHGYSKSQPKMGSSSPPPPAPPPHRVAYNAPVPQRIPSPSPSMNDRYPSISRAQSPAPRSPMAPGFTPSPLRDAMEDVMSSLHDMTLRRDERSLSPEQVQEPIDPWSPEAFKELQRKPHAREHRRPRSSLGIGSSQMAEDYPVEDFYHNQRRFPENDGSVHNPYTSDYSQHLEDRRQGAPDDKSSASDELFLPGDRIGPPPPPPKKDSPYHPRANSSLGMTEMRSDSSSYRSKLRNRKSAYELGREMLGRTFTTKSSATNSSSGVQSIATDGTSSTQRTSQSIMSGYSAGGFSATSAGSFARRKGLGSIGRSRPMSVVDNRQDALLALGDAPLRGSHTPLIGSSNSSNHDSRPESTGSADWASSVANSGGVFGGLTAPKARKSGFFKKLVESAKTGAASARSSIAAGQMEAPRSPIKNLLPNGVTAIAGGAARRDTGLGGGGKSGVDWVQVRRDINRSNSLSRNERADRIERCQLLNHPVIAPVEALFEVAEGDEGADGLPIEQPTDFQSVNLQLVDKSARFVNSLPPLTNSASLAQGYVCRPYRSDVQRLRAVFTWVSEKIAWEEDFEGEVDSRRVIQMKRGCAEEVAVLFMEMCLAIGLHAEVVRGYLKIPGEPVDYDSIPRPNHWWNAVVVDNGWRIMDCSLASPTNPKRGQYSSVGCQVAETGWFLARPMEMCYTHIPMLPQQQHICPPLAPDILLALPCACPTYFRNGIQMIEYDTSLTKLENLEILQIQIVVPPDIECFAEVETRTYARDADGDIFESGDTATTRALTQAEWIGGQKRYTVKAFLAGDDGQGTLKVYSGKRGLMHSIRDNPHALTFTLPISHTGTNPPYDFFIRHPTPHAQRHDLYVAQPQCVRLAVNNTFVFAVRQHPSSRSCDSPPPDTPFARPSSAMSMISTATSTTDYFSQASSSSSHSAPQQSKPAKLAIQAPSGKILRLMRKSENAISATEAADGGVWETIIKIGERGTWRGLVLADRSARWCVFGEWECV